MIYFPWLLVALCSCLVRSTLSPWNHQKVLDGESKAITLDQPSFGVGFDLTSSYGTAAVSFPNGTFVTVAKILGNDDYVEVLQRLSLDSSKHLSPPYQHIGDAWYDYRREWLRKAGKAIGLAASPEVYHLATMISDLRGQAEKLIGMPIDSATVATMRFPAFYIEDLHDVFEYVGLNYLPYSSLRNYILYETNAAFAGYGHGLCSNYTKVEECDRRQKDLPSQTVMAVLFTTNVLTVSLAVVKSAFSVWEPGYRRVVDLDAGYDARDRYESDENYWDRVRLRLEQPMIEHRYYERPAKVLLMGDCIGDENFERALIRALRNQMSYVPEIFSNDGEVAAAKGAAEFAKRYAYRSY